MLTIESSRNPYRASRFHCVPVCLTTYHTLRQSG